MQTQMLILGIVCMIAPGPVLIETVRRSIRGGLRSAALVQSGAMAGNLLYALLLVSGVGRLLLNPSIRFGLGLFGAALLVYLGYATLLTPGAL